MMYSIDETHAMELMSWVESANENNSDFPIQNLPYCVFTLSGDEGRRIGVGIGNEILDLGRCVEQGLIDVKFDGVVREQSLAGVMALSLDDRRELRRVISQLLSRDTSPVSMSANRTELLVSQADVQLHLPCHVGDYTDFYSSVYHATNVGSMFRPDNPLLPNYKHIPIGYHGRASSLVASGTDIRRPCGQLPPVNDQAPPTFGACQNLDYELEVAAFIGQGNRLGDSIDIAQAEGALFGICLLNDWSARDMQRWEYQPLGPFLAKSFASTLSPWVVTMEALAPFRCPAFTRTAEDPQPLPYLRDSQNESQGGIDLQLEVAMSSQGMRDRGLVPMALSRGSFRNMYWTFGQMVAHHSSNGCNLRTGDLLGSGTVSGPEKESRGCLMELTWDGEFGKPVPGGQRTPLKLPTGEERVFLADGDEVQMRAYCQRDGYRRIGFGKCDGIILPAACV